MISVLLISLLCNTLTIAVYLYLKELRNTLGKCVVSSLICLGTTDILVMNISEIVNQIILSVFNFFFISWHLWLSVISFHLWQVFRSNGFKEHRHQFLAYNAFVWITAAIVTAINIVELVDIGWLFLQVCDITMLILTVRNIWKVKRELKKFEQRIEMPPTCLNFDTQTYLQFIRLSILMGLDQSFSTILMCIFYFANDDFANVVLDVGYWFHNTTGILVFPLLVLKRSTLKLLKDKFKELL